MSNVYLNIESIEIAIELFTCQMPENATCYCSEKYISVKLISKYNKRRMQCNFLFSLIQPMPAQTFNTRRNKNTFFRICLLYSSRHILTFNVYFILFLQHITFL